MKRRAFCKVLAVTLAVVSLLCCLGCSREEKDISAEEVANQIVDGLEWEDTMRKLEDSVMSNFYDYEDGIVEEQAVFISDSGSTAEEVAVFKVKSTGDVQKMKDLMSSRLAVQRSQFENYIPEEMYKLNNAVIVSKDRIVALLVAGDAEAGNQLFESIMK